MVKLSLRIGELCVETFHLEHPAAAEAGTVLAQGTPPVDDPLTLDPCQPDTSWASCGQTCEVSCAGSCYATCVYQYTCADTCAAHCVPPTQPL
jgi:hypothetical protein